MSIFKKSWADMAYETDSDEEEDIHQVEAPLIQNLVNNPYSQLPRLFQRFVSMVQEQNSNEIEVTIRGCPSEVTEKDLKAILPITKCSIKSDIVSLYLKKQDIINHIVEKQLKEVILGKEVVLCIQRGDNIQKNGQQSQTQSPQAQSTNAPAQKTKKSHRKFRLYNKSRQSRDD